MEVEVSEKIDGVNFYIDCNLEDFERLRNYSASLAFVFRCKDNKEEFMICDLTQD